MRFCPKCRNDREDSEFNANGAKPSGVQGWCRECTTEYNRRWYAANREKHNRYVSEHKPRKIHTCKHCGRSEPDVSFYIKKQGDRYYRRFLCYGCDAEYKRAYPTRALAEKRSKERAKHREALSRQDPAKRYAFLVRYAKASDRKYKFGSNDLDRAFVRDLIAHGCMYCGDINGKMSLDRIDNSKGHTKDNVNPSCCRCNMFRRNMPYNAWMIIAPAVKAAREMGLLDGWTYGTRTHSQSTVSQKVVESLRKL